MKKIILSATVVSVLFFGACKNATKQQESNGQTTEQTATSSDILKSTLTSSEGKTLDLAFDNAKETATIVFNGETAELKQQPMASGIRYTNANYELTQWQGETELKKDGKTVFTHKEPTAEVTVNELVSADGKTLKAEYGEKDGKMIVTLTYDNQPAQTLEQLEAWAKGGVYKNDKMKWEAQGDNGKLTIDGKTIAFSPKK